MKFSYQVGLALLVNLAIAVGGILPGVGMPIGPIVVPKSLDTAQMVFDEGKKLALKDTLSSRQAIEKFKQALKLSKQNNNQPLQANSLVWLAIVYSNLDKKT